MIRNKRKFQGRIIYFRYKKFSWNNSFVRDKFAFRKHKENGLSYKLMDYTSL